MCNGVNPKTCQTCGILFKENQEEFGLKTIVNASPLACYVLDAHFNILKTNHKATKLFNIKESFSREYFKSFPECQPDGEPSLKKFQDKMMIAFKEGGVSFEWLHYDVNGKEMFCEIKVEHIFLKGRKFLLCYIIDLTEMKDLEKLAFKDALTDLYNRRYFLDMAHTVLKNNNNKERHFSIIMLDVDYFKNINDTYGHLVGDEVLRIISKRIVNVTEKNTVIARYGGEEFIVMLDNVKEDNTIEIANRIKNNISSTPIKVGCDIYVNVTVSIGIASNKNHNDELEKIIKKSDEALYCAKNSGRNTIIVA